MRLHSPGRRLALLAALGTLVLAPHARAQQPEPTVVDPNLAVRTVAEGFVQPTGLAFLGPNDMLVNEKSTGRVMRVTDGVIQGPVLDLAVNSNSERGLLGIALHPSFHVNGWVYLFWTESTTGVDTNVNGDVALLGNRVDRFVWDGTTLTHDLEITRFRAAQPAVAASPPLPAQNAAGNHDGGVIRFGPDGKLYVIVGDTGRRGWMQNLRCGPFGLATIYTCPPDPTVPDDAFGGPEPDDAHLTGVIVRLNDDGTTPADNPFFSFGAELGGEVGRNVQKIYAYGIRNSYGMNFDPISGDLWQNENGDDTFSELNRVEPGMNSGWVQIMGPLSRLHEFKQIETTPPFVGLQQNRWPPANIADSPEEALDRLFMLPGAHFSDPEFAWKFEVAPAALGFVSGRALGPQYNGDLFMGGARNFFLSGHIFRMEITGDRRKVGVDDPRIEDRVADNLAKFEGTESDSLVFGQGFGLTTDILQGPNGNLFVLSNTRGALYEIHRTRR
ncbi:MAG TPA: PQQ-dependent sugar dehydrogenase [Gaiellaceae bacterium]|nr:PQQ-dependent sugar dehydrogenase [Gaiellaceae bacterium]